MIFDAILRRLRERAVINKIPKNSIICDIGCGSHAHFFKKLSISKQIQYGFGFDKKIVNHNDSKFALKEIDIDKENIPLKNNSVDVATLLAVLEHLENPQHVLEEVSRILKTGGSLLLTTPSQKSRKMLEFMAFKMKIISKKDILEHKNYFTPLTIKELLLKSGFEEKKIKINYFEFKFNIFVLAEK